MERLTDELIRKLEIKTKVIVKDKKSNLEVGTYIVASKGLMMCEFIREDVYNKILSGEQCEAEQGNTLLTYCYGLPKQYEVYTYQEKREQLIFFEKLLSLLKLNKNLVNEKINMSIEQMAVELMNEFFIQVQMARLMGISKVVHFEVCGWCDGLKFSYDLSLDTWTISLELEKKMKYNDAIKYVSDETKKFKVECELFENIIDRALSIEDELSMSDDCLDTNEEFLNNFLQEETHCIMDILKFLTIYGTSKEVNYLIEDGIWIMSIEGLGDEHE